MIRIGQPALVKAEETTRLQCDFTDNNTKKTLWFEVENPYAPYLCHERADAFLVGLLYHGLKTGQDIVCDAPVTEELLYQLEEMFVPSICAHNACLHRSKIEAKTASAPLTDKPGTGVGTGLSCGVDSMYSIVRHLDSPYRDKRPTHLCVYNTGSFANHYANQRLAKDRIFKRAEAAAKAFGLPIITANANYQHAVSGNFLEYCTFALAFCVHALQKHWKTYYLSSNGDTNFYFNLDDLADSSWYDTLTLPCIGTDALRFYSSGMAFDRYNKLAVVGTNKTAAKYLHVCVSLTGNCGVCLKCRRTLTALDARGGGMLEKFSESFDIAYYKRHRKEYYEWVCDRKYAGDFINAVAYDHFMEQKRPDFMEFVATYKTPRDVIKRKNALTTDLNGFRNAARYLRRLLDDKATERIGKFLAKRNYQKIAFYDYGDVTRALCGIVRKLGVEVAYVATDGTVDRGVNKVSPREELPPVDALFISNMIRYRIVRERLETAVAFPMHTVYELIDMKEPFA